MAERCPITGTSLYLVLKSNGFRHSKNLPVKFGFLPKTVPANISKKLPLQRRPKPLFIASFNFSHKWPTFAFMGESGYTLGFQRKIAHSGPHGETGGISGGGGITTPGAFHTVRKPCVAGCKNGKLCRFWALVGCAPEGRRKPAEQRCAYACRCSEGVAAPLGCVICLQLGDVAVFSLCAQYFLNVRGEGWYHYPQRALRAAETLDSRLSKRLSLVGSPSANSIKCYSPPASLKVNKFRFVCLLLF